MYFIIILGRLIVVNFVFRIRENTISKRLNWTQPEIINWMKNKKIYESQIHQSSKWQHYTCSYVLKFNILLNKSLKFYFARIFFKKENIISYKSPFYLQLKNKKNNIKYSFTILFKILKKKITVI